jgi:hypothetical protein
MFQALIVVLWEGRSKQGKQLYKVYFKKVLGQARGGCCNSVANASMYCHNGVFLCAWVAGRHNSLTVLYYLFVLD